MLDRNGNTDLKPTIKIAETLTPDGKRMVLCEHDGDFSIALDGREVMTSREYESELELARLGCDRIRERRRARVLIGGLGLGYTLRETLNLLGSAAKVVVAELLPDVVAWNREHLGHLSGMPLKDPRVSVEIEDVAETIKKRADTWDAILLDVDNGPGGLTRQENDRLYGSPGLRTAFSALRPGGILAVWSSGTDEAFTRRLKQAGFGTEIVTLRARCTGKGGRHTIWLGAKPWPSTGKDSRPRGRKEERHERRSSGGNRKQNRVSGTYHQEPE